VISPYVPLLLSDKGLKSGDVCVVGFTGTLFPGTYIFESTCTG